MKEKLKNKGEERKDNAAEIHDLYEEVFNANRDLVNTQAFVLTEIQVSSLDAAFGSN